MFKAHEVGVIEFDDFKDCALPQKAASAWSAVMGEIIGVSYKPLLYIGAQLVHGTNYWFIAERTIVAANPRVQVVMLGINEYNGKYEFIDNWTEVVAG